MALHPILAVRVRAKRLQKHESIPVLGVHYIQAESLEEQIMSGTVLFPEITVPGVQGSPRAPGSSSRDTHGDQNSGVIWRGSSGRMLMESSARPQSRHSMVYSWGKEKGGAGKRGAATALLPHRETRARSGTRSPIAIRARGSRFQPHQLPCALFPDVCCIGDVPGMRNGGHSPLPSPTFSCPGELSFPHKAWTSAGGTPCSPEHRDAALNPSRLCPRKGGNRPLEGRVWNSRSRAEKGFWGTRDKPGSHPPR